MSLNTTGTGGDWIGYHLTPPPLRTFPPPLKNGATVDGVGRAFGSVRWRYFGPRPLIENNSARSAATSLANLEAGYKFSRTVRLALDVFNVLNAKGSDVDYFYGSRLPGEPAGGVEDVHFHPTLPRTARLSLAIGF